MALKNSLPLSPWQREGQFLNHGPFLAVQLNKEIWSQGWSLDLCVPISRLTQWNPIISRSQVKIEEIPRTSRLCRWQCRRFTHPVRQNCMGPSSSTHGHGQLKYLQCLNLSNCLSFQFQMPLFGLGLAGMAYSSEPRKALADATPLAMCNLLPT